MPQTNKTSLVYPGLLGKGKSRVNFENLQYQNPIRYEYIRFNYADTVGKEILRLPANSIILNSLLVTIDERFTPSSGITLLEIYRFTTNEKLFGIALIGIGTLDLGNPVSLPFFSEKETLILRLTNFPLPAAATITSGRGWLILQWLNLNLVDSYRKERYA